MGKVVKLNPLRKEYFSEINKIAGKLSRIERDLMTGMINLAASGAWHDWNANVPVGEIITFTPEMLSDVDDPQVASLRALHEQVLRVEAVFKKVLQRSK